MERFFFFFFCFSFFYTYGVRAVHALTLQQGIRPFFAGASTLAGRAFADRYYPLISEQLRFPTHVIDLNMIFRGISIVLIVYIVLIV